MEKNYVYFGFCQIIPIRPCWIFLRMQKAKGGILFVDEAYRLKDSSDAVAEIMLRLNSTNDFILILAGYPEEMQELFGLNNGLPRRFYKLIRLDDYEPKDIAQICVQKAQEHKYSVNETELTELLKEKCSNKRFKGVGPSGKTFSKSIISQYNAGLCEHLLFNTEKHKAKRLEEKRKKAERPTAGPDEENILIKEDFEEGLNEWLNEFSLASAGWVPVLKQTVLNSAISKGLMLLATTISEVSGFPKFQEVPSFNAQRSGFRVSAAELPSFPMLFAVSKRPRIFSSCVSNGREKMPLRSLGAATWVVTMETESTKRRQKLLSQISKSIKRTISFAIRHPSVTLGSALLGCLPSLKAETFVLPRWSHNFHHQWRRRRARALDRMSIFFVES